MSPHPAYRGIAWNPSTGFWEYVRTSAPKAGQCQRVHCRKEADGKICSRCRKRLSRLNNPWAERRNVIKSRAKKRGQEFQLTTKDIKKIIRDAGLEAAFICDPDSVHIDRIDPLKGYTEDNTQALTQNQNLKKSANDKRRHEYARQKYQGQIDCPF